MLEYTVMTLLVSGSDVFALLALIGAGTVLSIAGSQSLRSGLRATRRPIAIVETAFAAWVLGAAGLAIRVFRPWPEPPLLGYTESFLATLLLGSVLILACSALIWFTTRPERTGLPGKEPDRKEAAPKTQDAFAGRQSVLREASAHGPFSAIRR